MYENVLHKVLQDHMRKTKTKTKPTHEWVRKGFLYTRHTMSTKTWKADVGEELVTMLLLLVVFVTSLLARAIACGG